MIPSETDEVFVAADNLYRRIKLHYFNRFQRHANRRRQAKLAVTVLRFTHLVVVNIIFTMVHFPDHKQFTISIKCTK